MNQPIWPWLVVARRLPLLGRRLRPPRPVRPDWLWVAIGRLRDKILGRVREAEVPETMSRLRSRKQEIGEQIEGRRTAARFEITDPTAAAGPIPLDTDPAAGAPKPPTSSPTMKPDAPDPESYTERLLKAKKQVWRDRDEEK